MPRVLNSDGFIKQAGFISGALYNPMTTSGNMVYGGLSGVPLSMSGGSNGYALQWWSGIPQWVSGIMSGAVPFKPAGSGHLAGAVPDPGATAHSNYPYFLGDDASFHVLYGQVLGTSYVATDQNTTSGTPGNLATAQSVSFTLDETSNILVIAICNAYHSTTGVCVLTSDLDGANTTLGSFQAPFALGQGTAGGMVKYSSVAAGAHTVTLEFSTSSATANFRWRTLIVLRVP